MPKAATAVHMASRPLSGMEGEERSSSRGAEARERAQEEREKSFMRRTAETNGDV